MNPKIDQNENSKPIENSKKNQKGVSTADDLDPLMHADGRSQSNESFEKKESINPESLFNKDSMLNTELHKLEKEQKMDRRK